MSIYIYAYIHKHKYYIHADNLLFVHCVKLYALWDKFYFVNSYNVQGSTFHV